MKEYFKKSIERYKKLVFVEREFGVAFVPKDLVQNIEAWTDLEEVYLTLFAASLLSNAIVKKINEAADGEIKILYGSEDSRPMFISYRGFKTEGEAKEEMKKIMNHKDDYTNALTVAGHINKKISG